MPTLRFLPDVKLYRGIQGSRAQEKRTAACGWRARPLHPASHRPWTPSPTRGRRRPERAVTRHSWGHRGCGTSAFTLRDTQPVGHFPGTPPHQSRDSGPTHYTHKSETPCKGQPVGAALCLASSLGPEAPRRGSRSLRLSVVLPAGSEAGRNAQVPSWNSVKGLKVFTSQPFRGSLKNTCSSTARKRFYFIVLSLSYN